jgi:N-acyl-D-amino-acid deacylase
MEQGAVGMSSGLTYTPGMYASTSELTALCQELATFPGSFYAPHHRSYGKGALEAYEEMLQIGRDTGAAIHLTHATMNFAENRGRGKDMLSLVDSARADGVDVTLDTYPYLPGCTTLSAMLPSWAQEGGPHMTLERLRSPIIVEQIKRDVEEGCDGGHGLPIDWTTIEVSGLGDADMAQRFSGKTIMEIAVIENRNPADMFVRILIDDKLRTSIIMHVGNEENVQCIMQHEVHCGGSDA